MRKAVLHLKKSDPILSQIIKQVGPYNIEYREPDFETLVRAIVYQQLNGKVAATIFGRLTAAAAANRLTPEAVLKLSARKMRALGLSPQKTRYIRDLARRTRSGVIDFPALLTLPDDKVVEHLVRLKGVGVWTAHMFLIFALRRANVLPTGDFGIRAAIQKAYGLPQLPKPADIESLARNWRPYCTVASWYLWRSLDSKAGL